MPVKWAVSDMLLHESCLACAGRLDRMREDEVVPIYLVAKFRRKLHEREARVDRFTHGVFVAF